MIAITQQKKEELITKIQEFERIEKDTGLSEYGYGQLFMLKEILSETIEIPVEQDLNNLPLSVLTGKQKLSDYYPNGLIIKP